VTIKQDKITHDGKGMNDEVSFVEIKLHSCQLHVLNLMAPDGLSFTLYGWLRQWPLWWLWWKRSYWAFSASISRS